MTPTNTTKVLSLSGRGDRVLVSKGAEAFDPESLLGDDPPLSPAHPTPKQSVLVLSLSPPLATEILQVAGFLHKFKTSSSSMSLEMECLFSLALVLSELALSSERTAFVDCEFRVSGQEEPSKLELPYWLMDRVHIEEVMGTRARVQLYFVKVEPKTPGLVSNP